MLRQARLLVDNPAVVLDIDGTILLSEDRGWRCQPGIARISRGMPDVTVFVITARRDVEVARVFTMHQLSVCNVHAAEVIMRPDGCHGTVAAFKKAARDAIRRQGYQILLAVGDKGGDISGQMEAAFQKDTFHKNGIYAGMIGDENKSFGLKLPEDARPLPKDWFEKLCSDAKDSLRKGLQRHRRPLPALGYGPEAP